MQKQLQDALEESMAQLNLSSIVQEQVPQLLDANKQAAQELANLSAAKVWIIWMECPNELPNP